MAQKRSTVQASKMHVLRKRDCNIIYLAAEINQNSNTSDDAGMPNKQTKQNKTNKQTNKQTPTDTKQPII